MGVKTENITVDKGVEVKVGDKEYTGDGKALPANTTPSSSGGGGGTTTVSVTLNSATADGAAGTTTSTKIDLAFSAAISGLTANDITIANDSGSATKGALTGSGTNWSIAISNISEGNVSIAVASPSGYRISGSPKTVSVYKDVAGPASVTLNSATADGAPGTTTSTKIDLEFSSAIVGLTASDITITDGTGSAAKGAITGSGANWSIALTSVTTEGTVTVSISDPASYSISGSSKTVNIYKEEPGALTVNSVEVTGNENINVIFNKAPENASGSIPVNYILSGNAFGLTLGSSQSHPDSVSINGNVAELTFAGATFNLLTGGETATITVSGIVAADGGTLGLPSSGTYTEGGG